MTSHAGRTLTWNHENRLESVSGGGLPTESYLYNATGSRIWKTAGSTIYYYIFPHYEKHNTTVVKYYFFGGQRHPRGSRMKQGSTFTYLHSDQLG